MDIYLLHAHDFSYLPYQVWAINKFIPNSKITVVQGPFRLNPWDSKVKLCQNEADKLGVSIMEITKCDERPLNFRLLDLYNSILALPGMKLILQGDCLPDREVELFFTKPLAGRGVSSPNAGSIFMDYTWMWAEKSMKLPSRFVDEKDVNFFPAFIMDQKMNVEYCPPGFLHLDKISQSNQVGEKLGFLKKHLGIELEAIQVESLDNDLPAKQADLSKKNPHSIYEIKESLKTNLHKLPEDLAAKYIELSAGCGCKLNPWIRKNSARIRSYL